MCALMCRTLRMLSFLPQLIGLGSGHLARIDESIHAYVRELFYRAGHAGAKGLTAERIDLAIPLIVRSTILFLTLGNGSRNSWKQNEGGGGNCNPHSGTVFGSHIIQLLLAQQGQAPPFQNATHGPPCRAVAAGKSRPSQAPLVRDASSLAHGRSDAPSARLRT
jgi:hypothetical protein